MKLLGLVPLVAVVLMGMRAAAPPTAVPPMRRLRGWCVKITIALMAVLLATGLLRWVASDAVAGWLLAVHVAAAGPYVVTFGLWAWMMAAEEVGPAPRCGDAACQVRRLVIHACGMVNLLAILVVLTAIVPAWQQAWWVDLHAYSGIAMAAILGGCRLRAAVWRWTEG